MVVAAAAAAAAVVVVVVVVVAAVAASSTHCCSRAPKFVRFGGLDFATPGGFVSTFWDLDFEVIRGCLNMSLALWFPRLHTLSVGPIHY